MKTLRLHLWIIFAFFGLTFILGSIFDQQLSQAIFSRDNAFGLTVSILAVIPGYFVLSFLAGGFLSIALRKQYKISWTIFCYIMCVALIVVTIIFQGREFFGTNGFNLPNIKWLGYVISVPTTALFTFIGYKAINKSERKTIINILILFVIAAFMSLISGTTLLKVIFHRPRYRTITLYDEINFHNWWQVCSNYKDLMSTTGVLSEEFKSFPSGHAGTAAFFMAFAIIAPLVSEKLAKHQYTILYCGFAWTLLVMFSRMLVGAHFLSDVSMGSILTVVMIVCANEWVIYATKRFEKN